MKCSASKRENSLSASSSRCYVPSSNRKRSIGRQLKLKETVTHAWFKKSKSQTPLPKTERLKDCARRERRTSKLSGTMLIVSLKRRLKQQRRDESRRRRSLRSSDFESYRNALQIVKAKLTLSEPSEPSRTVSVDTVEKRKKRLNWLESRLFSLIRPVESNLSRRRS